MKRTIAAVLRRVATRLDPPKPEYVCATNSSTANATAHIYWIPKS